MKVSPTFAPILKPLLFLLHDPRFVIALLSLLPLLVPETAPYEQLILLVAFVLICGYSVESGLTAAKAAPLATSVKGAENTIVTVALSDLITYLTQAQTTTTTDAATNSNSTPPASPVTTPEKS
jgi:threonine/homoserine/homoserine lactone efflux protein